MSLFKLKQKYWLLVLPLLGVMILITFVKLKSAPKQIDNALNIPNVVVSEVAQRKLQYSITGYGRAQAKQIWHAVSEVSGRVIYKHPDLEVGAILSADTVLLKIDPIDYELKLAQAKYDLNAAQERLDMIAFNKQKLTQSLALESERLAILRQELTRLRGLLKRGSVSQSAVDQQQSQLFSQQQKVLELQTSLNLIPSDLALAKASVSAQSARMQEAQNLLEKTVFTLPKDSKITQVNVELQQVVNARSTLLEARHLGVMKVNAQFNMSQARKMLSQVWLEQNKDSQTPDFPNVATLPLQASLNYYSSGNASEASLQWPAKVTRLMQSTEHSNSLQVILETENQWLNFDPINRPPLLENMFLEVQMSSPEAPYLSVPVSSVHDNYVFVVEDKKLIKKPVKVLFDTNQFAALDSQLPDTVRLGDKVLLTQLLPTLDGMQVNVVEVLP
ncbi:efflux RND transporter periplasmic adaptor subunit [Pseudoalteromonas sp. S16_S37]|uniref:efflux RND transporter periplasmic adaptor subunit n=1 Tax=Pseudoalteromonas sp. S16_S37 TaxID=2720228 RepID=UPI001680D92F|nr:hypothetical protein [Pseudoalteromonas sp. S16_S37]MBD1582609.1 hypothetical protein [Pseudoalteromonas sp. S16_S37]